MVDVIEESVEESWSWWWDDAWAQGTLDVVNRASRSTGYYWGPRAAYLREELRDWMVVEAMRLRARYVPPETDDDAETVWYRVLYRQLQQHASNFHRAAQNRGDLHSLSLDGLQEEADEAGRALPPLQHLTGHNLDVLEPPHWTLLRETLSEGIDPRMGPPKPANLCVYLGCQSEAGKRGLCHVHYGVERRLALGECSVIDCESHAHTAGLCSKHYQRLRKAQADPCMDLECDRPQVSRGLCQTCAKRYRSAGIAPPLAGRGKR